MIEIEQTYKGTVEGIQTKRKRFTVVTLRLRGGDKVNCGGYFPSGLCEGDEVRISGEWSTDEKWGKQFRATDFAWLVQPEWLGHAKWMAHALPDVGMERAIGILRSYGDPEFAIDIMLTDPKRLAADINGITLQRAEKIAATLAKSQNRETLVRLYGFGFTKGQVSTLKEHFGDLSRAAEEVATDPYMLADKVDGFGFARADRIARRTGIAQDAPRRVETCVLHTLKGSEIEGHCFLPARELVDSVSSQLGVPDDLVIAATKRLQSCSLVVIEEQTVWRRALNAAEIFIADFCAQAMASNAAQERTAA